MACGNNKKHPKTRFLHYAVMLLCLLGTVSQVFDATQEYMRFDTLTQVHIVNLDSLALPAIGVCSSYDQKRFGNMTIANRLVFTSKITDVLNHCNVLNPKTLKYSDCLSVTRVQEYIDSSMKCYSFFELDSLLSEVLTYDQVEGEFQTFDLNMSVPAGSKIPPLLVVYPNDDSFAMKRNSHNKKWVAPEGTAEFVFTFEIEEHILLPPPYSTKCFHFEKTKHRTRAVAVDKCIMRNFEINGTHYLPYLTYASRKDSVNDLTQHTIGKDLEKALVDDAMKICDLIIPSDDCRTLIYKIIPKSSYPGPPGQDTVRVVLAGLPATSLWTEIVPLYSIMDFVNWIGNIGNLWFGFNLFSSSVTAASILQSPVKQIKHLLAPTRKRKRRRRRQHRSRFTTILGMAIKVTSMCLATFQIWDILTIYVENPFTWNYFTNLPDFLPFPTAVFCVDRVMDGHKVQTLFPRVFNTIHPEKWDQVLTVDQQLQVTPDANQLISNKSRFTSTETMAWEKLHEFQSFEKYVNHKHLCFKTFSDETRTNQTFPQSLMKRTLSELMQYFTVYVNVNGNWSKQINEVSMVIQFGSKFMRSGSRSLLQGASQNIIIPITKERRLWMDMYMTYHRVLEVNYFADHFKATCLSYTTHYGKDRVSLITNCVKSHIMRSLSKSSPNEWPRGLFYSASMSDMDSKILNQQPLVFSENNSLLEMYEADCGAKFPMADCETSSVEVIIEDFISNFNDGTLLRITLYPPGKGYIKLQQQLRFSVLSLLGFVGGTIGFWIGFALIDIRHLIPQAFMMIQRHIGKKKRRATRQHRHSRDLIQSQKHLRQETCSQQLFTITG